MKFFARRGLPQGLKPSSIQLRCGTSKLVPWYEPCDTKPRMSFSGAWLLLPDEGKEFGSGFFLAEAADHGGGYGGRVLLLNSAHHHAQVAGFDNYAYALRRDRFLD